MDPDRWRQIEQLYHQALEKDASERARFLDQACSSDPSLRQEIESLLAVTDDADGYLKAAIREATPQPSGASAAHKPVPEGSFSTRKLGRYELLEQVGRGGMGVVYRAVDPAIGRTVAIKTIVLDDGTPASSELRTRLLRESQAGGQLTHPNIVAVYDVSEQGNTAYIVMEYVVGRTLDRAMANEPSVRLPNEALRIIRECANALDYAHSRGVVHRDVKPANIMLQSDGTVKIADFGIAKAAQFTQLTQSAMILGSPQYMAPEQWKGEAVTGRTDQYALAAVAYGLLTGHRPFEGETMASLAAKALYEDPPAATSLNPALPPALDSVFHKALSKSPAARFESCSQFAGALRTACEKTVTAAFAAPPAPAVSRRPVWQVAAIGAVVIAAVAGGTWVYQRSSSTQVEIAYWNSIKDSKSNAPFDAYLRRYPEGQFAGLAQAQLDALKQPPTTQPHVTPPPVEAKTPAKVNPSRLPGKSRGDSEQPPTRPVTKPNPPPVADPYGEADALLKRGAYAEALPYFGQAIALKPDYRSYFGRAGAYQRLERLEPAIADYTQAIRLNPSSAMAYHERAVCLAQVSQDDRALADYNKALELAPTYALSWNGRGVIHLRRREYEKAVADFTEAIRLRPTYDQPYKNRAAAKKALGDASGANEDLNQAKALKQ
jgi:tetratricopeptide (TPR) repeat protein